MSINALTNDVLRQRVQQGGGTAEATELAVQQNQVSKNASALVKYIPIESITLYVAAVAATPALQKLWPMGDGNRYVTISYWVFAFLTPVFVLLLDAAKRRSANVQPAFPSLKEWPRWKMSASTFAFLAWALAVPNGPFLREPNLELKGAIGAFLALFVSTLLSLLEPWVEGH